MDWISTHKVIFDAQFGFTPGSGTGDAIFALHGVISNVLSEKKSLYCRFIDYKCAFDSVVRIPLWNKLISSGINGK